MDDPQTLARRLREPFAPADLKFKAQVVRGERALAVCYVDARAIEDRLDEVLGPDCWQDGYELLPNGSVVCTLRVRIGGEWVVKSDVGSQSEQPDEGDRVKSAFSDALKRAAVKLGIGRYLYRLPQQWVPYDPQKRQIKQDPGLPAWALPAKQPPVALAQQPPAALVSKAQWAAVEKAIKAGKGLSAAKVLAAYGVDRPGELTAVQAFEAMVRVEARDPAFLVDLKPAEA